MGSGSGGFSGRVVPCAAPVVASGSVHAGDPSGGPVVPAFGCLPGQRISSGEPVHTGDPSGGPVVPARMGLVLLYARLACAVHG